MANKRKIDKVDEVESVQSVANKKRARRHVRRPRTMAVEAFNHAPPTASFFTKLPREVRDMIYDHLLSHAPAIKQQYKRQIYTVTYGQRFGDMRTYEMSWLLTNKQMLLEGLRQFHERSIWIFAGGRTQPSEYVFPLITPGRVPTFHVGLGRRTSHVNNHEALHQPFQQRDSIDPGWEPLEHTADGIERYFWLQQATKTDLNTMTRSSEVGEGVKEMKVIVHIPQDLARSVQHEGRQQFPRLYSFDLSYFERLAVHRGLRTFEADIFVYYWFQPDSREESQKVIQTLMAEFERIGVLLTKGAVATSYKAWHTGVRATVRCANGGTAPSLNNLVPLH
jgi:hypothetical protein